MRRRQRDRRRARIRRFLSPDPHDDRDRRGDRQRQEDPDDAEQLAPHQDADEDAERRDMERPAVDARHEQVALDLLVRHLQRQNPNLGRHRDSQPREHRRHGRDRNAEDWDRVHHSRKHRQQHRLRDVERGQHAEDEDAEQNVGRPAPVHIRKPGVG